MFGEMGFEICRLKCQIGISYGVALRESIIGELSHQRENLLSLIFSNSARDCAVDKLLLLKCHLLPILLAHGLAETIRLSHGVTGKLLRQMHRLFLVHDDAVCAIEDLLHRGNNVTRRLLAVMALNKVVHHTPVDWPRAV